MDENSRLTIEHVLQFFSRKYPDRELNFLTLTKGDEKYIFVYDDERSDACLEVLGRFVSNPELSSFNWYDVGVLAYKIKEESIKRCLRERLNLHLSGLDDRFE